MVTFDEQVDMSEESSNSGSGDTSSMHQYQHQSSCGNISMGTSSYKSYEDDGFSVTRIVDATAESACHLGATSSADLASAACDMQQLELSCETSSIEPSATLLSSECSWRAARRLFSV